MTKTWNSYLHDLRAIFGATKHTLTNSPLAVFARYVISRHLHHLYGHYRGPELEQMGHFHPQCNARVGTEREQRPTGACGRVIITVWLHNL